MFKFPRPQAASAVGKRLQIHAERLGELSPAELRRVVAAVDRRHKCACTTDVSNSCCGPNGSC
jgi:hypothetical protein